MAAISPSIRNFVFERANHCCEYCKTSRRVIGMPLVIDHVIPMSNGGTHDPANLCASCYRCNEHKGSKTQVFDNETNVMVTLFNPRVDRWLEHFIWGDGGTQIIGLTAIGRVSDIGLRLNNPYVVESRSLWVARGWHPPLESP